MGVFNKDDLAQLNEVMAEIGVDFPPLFSTGQNILMEKNDILKLRPELKKLENDRKDGKLDYNMHVEPSLYEIDDWNVGKDVPGCIHLWSQISVNAFGQAVPCIWYDGMNLGDVRNGNLMDVWKGQKFQYFRKNYLQLTACRKCCYFYLTFWENFKRALKVPSFPFKKLLGLNKEKDSDQVDEKSYA